MKIEWQSPSSDKKHEIPELAHVIFTLKDKSRVRFSIQQLSDGTEYLERETLHGDMEIIDRRTGPMDRRK